MKTGLLALLHLNPNQILCATKTSKVSVAVMPLIQPVSFSLPKIMRPAPMYMQFFSVTVNLSMPLHFTYTRYSSFNGDKHMERGWCSSHEKERGNVTIMQGIPGEKQIYGK